MKIIYLVLLLFPATAQAAMRPAHRHQQHQIPADLHDQMQVLNARAATSALPDLQDLQHDIERISQAVAQYDEQIARNFQARYIRCLQLAQNNEQKLMNGNQDIIPLFAHTHACEVINRMDHEPISYSTFDGIVQEQQEKKDLALVARVVTRERNGSEFIHYYDAFCFIKHRFGRSYSLKGPLKVENVTNPLNGLAVGDDDIMFFAYDTQHPQLGFRFAFSHSDLVARPELRLMVNKNQNEDRQLKDNAILLLNNSRLRKQLLKNAQ